MKNKKSNFTIVITIMGLLSASTTFALTPPQGAGSTVSNETPDIVPKDNENQTLGALTQAATHNQLLAAEEKMKAEYLKNKLARLKLENDIKLEEQPFSQRQVYQLEGQGNSGIPDVVEQTLHMPSIPALNLDGATPKEVKKKETPKKKTASAFLIEVTGSIQHLVARIQVDGITKNYSLGDKVKKARIQDITMERVVLTDGTILEI